MIPPRMEIDFVKRTKKILEFYEKHENNEEYDVTLYLNCLTGLIILPRENLHFVKKPKEKKQITEEKRILECLNKSVSTDNLPIYYSDCKLCDKLTVEKKIKNCILTIRNCIGHLCQQKENNKFSEIIFLNDDADLDTRFTTEDAKFNETILEEIRQNCSKNEGEIKTIIFYNQYDHKVLIFKVKQFKNFVNEVADGYLEFKEGIK